MPEVVERPGRLEPVVEGFTYMPEEVATACGR